MAPRFFYHETTENQHTFIAPPTSPTPFTGWGPKI
jgi:hypothetical protein